MEESWGARVVLARCWGVCDGVVMAGGGGSKTMHVVVNKVWGRVALEGEKREHVVIECVCKVKLYNFFRLLYECAYI